MQGSIKKEIIITTYSAALNGKSAYSYLIREDNGKEILDSKLIENCDIPGKAELIGIVVALKSIRDPSLILLYPYHTHYLSQEFSNLENGIKHLAKPNTVDIFDDLEKILKFHEIIIEYSNVDRPETGLLNDATLAILNEKINV
jgi:hypothetical protein